MKHDKAVRQYANELKEEYGQPNAVFIEPEFFRTDGGLTECCDIISLYPGYAVCSELKACRKHRQKAKRQLFESERQVGKYFSLPVRSEIIYYGRGNFEREEI